MKLPKPSRKLVEWFVVCLVATLMSRVSYYLLDLVTEQNWSEWRDTGWVFWSCGVSIATWTLIWYHTRGHSRGVWMFMGAWSPLFGCALFFPATPWALSVLASYWYFIIPIGIATGIIFHTVLSVVNRFQRSAVKDSLAS